MQVGIDAGLAVGYAVAMNSPAASPAHAAFHRLAPDLVLDLVEKALAIRCTNLCRPLASYINRVFELEGEDGKGLVVKFYRPGRWSRGALKDEHDFLLELAGREIPVIAPLLQAGESSLGEYPGGQFPGFSQVRRAQLG